MKRTRYDLGRFWPPFKFTLSCMVSVAYHHLNIRGNTDIVFHLVTPQNNMILVMSLLCK